MLRKKQRFRQEERIIFDCRLPIGNFTPPSMASDGFSIDNRQLAIANDYRLY